MFKVLRSRATIYTAEPCQRQQQGCPRLRVVAYTFQTFQLKGPSPTSASIILLSLAKGNKDVQGCVLLPIHLPAFQCNSCQHLFEAMLTMVPSNVLDDEESTSRESLDLLGEEMFERVFRRNDSKVRDVVASCLHGVPRVWGQEPGRIFAPAWLEGSNGQVFDQGHSLGGSEGWGRGPKNAQSWQGDVDN
eukprot:1156843-Pelagomonas_calceolata.AAC.14